MSQASPPPAPPGAPADALRVVLFGMPAAGKSSLLGALAQAAQSQEHLLNGRLTDLSHGLDELRHRLYDEHGRRTAEEVVPYAVDYEPFSDDGPALEAHHHFGATVVDCDGRVANDLLVRHKALDEDSPEGTLAREVLNADTLVLVVDASAPPTQINADFAEFDRFLRLLERGRGERAEVGGLPVYVVLTKCDLLAHPGDTAADWMERIEQRKREVDAHFRDFLARRAAAAGPVPFGRIDLHLWATAVMRPALAGVPAKAREPYGVAELFRQCLGQAAAFRARRRRSGRRLWLTVGGAGGLAAAMLALAVGLAVTNRVPAPVAARVEELRALDRPTAAERLSAHDSELKRREAALAALGADPAFATLPPADQEWVRARDEELKDYLAFLDRLRHAPKPEDAVSEEALAAVEASLEKELALPSTAWEDTEAGRLRRARLAEIKALREAVRRAKKWYQENLDKGLALWGFAGHKSGGASASINWRAWNDEAEPLLDPAHAPPFKPDDPIPGTDPPLRYATALRFEGVTEARADWDTRRRKLSRVRDLACALGLVSDVRDRPPVLAVPRPPGFRFEQAAARLDQLKQAYPEYATAFVPAGLPEAAEPEIRQAARMNYEYLLEPGRGEVLRRLREAGSGEEETAARWAAVQKWLASGPPELAAWRVLATVLGRLQDPDTPDPVTALAAFLEKESFALDLQVMRLEIPDKVEARPDPGAKLTVFHQPAGGDATKYTFEPSGEGQRDVERRVRTYTFRPTSAARWTYRPGDALWAELPLRDGQMFTWARDRSLRYQFERLARPPRLHKSGEPSSSGTLAEGVRLLVTPPDGLPRVPDLLPVVRF
jgi:hypothetical protein